MTRRTLLLSPFLVLPVAAASGEGARSTFEGEGRVLAIDEARSTVSLDHGPIEGLMPAMRMRFTVARRAQLRRIKVGDAVRFSLGSRGHEMVILSIEPLPVDLIRISGVL